MVQAQYKTPQKPGLTILGTRSHCGKTVVTSGISGFLHEEGINNQVFKPLSLAPKTNIDSELLFLSKVSKTENNYPTIYIESQHSLSKYQWLEAIRLCQAGVEPSLVELPGGCASPLLFSDEEALSWLDCSDFALELGFPCLLVANYDPFMLEQIILSSNYLLKRGLDVLGIIISCSTLPTMPSTLADNLTMSLQEKTTIPFLGYLEHSASINVPLVNQGNVIKTTSNGVDLLPIIKRFAL